ncbi:HAD family hydrolase [Microbacterium sp. 179-I 3D4 NHS]|uniref:HAD family hydrolase n=1 Tax=Microbacterium sp. 179-I 3D4 NHS TaxID=3142381 RepID=UPI0039A11AD9
MTLAQVRGTSTGTRHYDAIVFDCDGVLVDSEEISMRVSQRILADLGWEADLPTLLEMFTGCSHEYFVSQVEERIGRRLEPGWNDPYAGRLEEALRSGLRAIPGVADALDRIALPKAVASNSGHERIRLSLQAADLLHHFDGRISSAEDVRAGKPAPDVYEHAAASLGVPPERCLAIDDSRFGVRAAQSAGMRVIAFIGDDDGGTIPTGDGIVSLSSMGGLADLVDDLVSGRMPR